MPNDVRASSVTARAEWLKLAIDKSIDYMNKRRDINRNRAIIIKITTVILSGIGAVLLGLNLAGWDGLFRNIAFVLVTTVTLLNALEPFFNFRSLWVEQENALAGFYYVKDDLYYYLAGVDANSIKDENMTDLYNFYRRVWEKHNEAWITHRRSDSPSPMSAV